jgi:hypothetical protein
MKPHLITIKSKQEKKQNLASKPLGIWDLFCASKLGEKEKEAPKV